MFCLATILASVSALAAADDSPASLPDPGGKPAGMSKPVQVFIIMGQPNTREMGHGQGHG